MELIVAVENNWGIGYNNNLLCSIPEDMKHFIKTTTGKTVVMGRNTYDSLRTKPLPKRTNIVLTSREIEPKDSLITCKSVEDVFNYVRNLNPNMVCVMGGEQVYRLLLDYCSLAYVTKMYKDMPHDKSFPNLDLLENWRISDQSDGYYNGEQDIYYQFFTYQNDRPKSLIK